MSNKHIGIAAKPVLQSMKRNTHMKDNLIRPASFERAAILLTAAVLAFAPTMHGAEPAAPAPSSALEFDGGKSTWHDGFVRYDYLMDENTLAISPFTRPANEGFGVGSAPAGKRRCIVVVPKTPAAGLPWSWQGCYWDHRPQAEVELLHRGFCIAFITPSHGKQWDAWYAFLTETHGLSKKPVFVGMSMGGVHEYNWAIANPTKVSAIYADNPGIQATDIPKIAELARYDVPLLNVCGTLDFVLERCTLVIENIYEQAGGRISILIKEGTGHHPHSLQDPKIIADFLEQGALTPPAPRPAFLDDTFIKSYYYSLSNTYIYLPKEDTYATCRGPAFSPCYARYDKRNRSFADFGITVLVPNTPAAGKPWVLRADRIGRTTSPVDLALLAKGYYIAVPPLLGGRPERKEWNQVYQLMTDAGFSKKPALEGAGAGAGEAYGWAVENADKVSCIYAENPVLRSLMIDKNYGENSKPFPVDDLSPLVKAGVPILHVCGSLDPWLDRETRVAEKKYKELGGNFTVIVKPGEGHFPVGPQDPTPVVNFIQAAAAGASVPDQLAAKAAIQKIVRALAGGQADSTSRSPAVTRWLEQNREAVQDVRPGPFPATDRYVTVYRGGRIYLHILDWTGNNIRLSLPSINDRLILNAHLMNGKPVRIGQAPWGISGSVPTSDLPNDIDAIIVLETEGDAGELAAPRTVSAKPLETILLQAENAKPSGRLRYNAGPDWIEGWTDSKDTICWRVTLPSAADYEMQLTYACPSDSAGAVLNLMAGEQAIRFTTRETTGFHGGWENYERRGIEGRLRLNAGTTDLTLSAVKKAGGNEILRIYGLYLVPVEAKPQNAEAVKRAQAARADPTWFRNAKYGVMFHWTPQTQPRQGAAKPFSDAVRDFNVDAFARMIEDAGAAYVIFTTSHGTQWMPAPIAAVEKVLPNRTSSRDMLGDLANALAQRGIKLIFYYHHGVGDYDWSRNSGFYRKDKTQFFDNEAAILTELGNRYGDKVAGWWFDDRFPLQPFERLWQAAKAGNPARLVAFNSWHLPMATPFQDYYAGELGGELRIPPERGYFDADGPQSGLAGHILLFLDDAWNHTSRDQPIKAPLFKDEDLIRYVRTLNARGIPVTMNIAVYQDGTASPATLDQLRTVRKAIR
jgi:pimeloyl-ACP methyl ester carboxylesterase